MVNSNKITTFSSLDDLKNAVKKDLDDITISGTRFPIRFIFLNSHKELKKVTDVLTDNADKVELSDFLHSDEGWLSNDEIINGIKQIDENSVVLPISEYIRFSNDSKFYEFLSALAEIENANIKLYVPLVGLWKRFENVFWKDYYRKDNWAPIWRLDSDWVKIEIYQVDFKFDEDIETNDLELVSNTKDWFTLWKKNDIKKIISLARPLSIYSDCLPDKTFTLENIKTPKEYLSKIFDMHLNIEYNPDENEYWNNLLIEVSVKNKKNISLNDIFVEKFNIKNINNLTVEDYLKYYLNNTVDSYKQWIVKNVFLTSKKFENSYLRVCFSLVNDFNYNNLAKKVFLEIFNHEYSEDFLDERRRLLKYLVKYDFSLSKNEFKEKYDNLDLSIKQKLNYLTDTSYMEKELIIDVVRNSKNIPAILQDLKNIFPELYYYMDWNLRLNENIPSWILEYFEEYNKSKLLNIKSETLNSLILDNNSPDNFYKWYYGIEKIDIEKSNGDYIVWIDALGTEWLPLLVYFLNKFCSDKKISKSIRTVNIPSATEFNKMSHDKKIDKLDKYIHDNHYNYPKSLLEEIDLIKGFAEEISKIDSPKIHIVSDHGFSFLSNNDFGISKKYDFKDSKHEGRYLLVGDRSFKDNEDYLVYKTESINHDKQKYIVSLNHISLYNTPSHEVHGGATPEEVLVPYITIEDDKSKIDYEIKSQFSEINVSMNNELIFNIYPEPPISPLAIYNGENLEVSKKGTEYIINIDSNMDKGNQKIIIKLDDIEKELEITIKKGGMEEEEYDFG